MKTAAVICEYNPMHEGHLAMLREVRRRIGEDVCLICLMSGDFVQRGEPAIYDKYARAGKALEGGADLVLELPYPWSASAGAYFARGAFAILKGAGLPDHLFFGSEGKDEEELLRLAAVARGEAFEREMTALCQRERSLSYPKRTARCFEITDGADPRLRPNEILALEYCKCILGEEKKIAAHALPMLAGHSASALRAELKERREAGIALLERGERAILTHLLLTGGKGRFARAARRASTLEQLLEEARFPQDSDAALRRALLAELLDSAGLERNEPRFTVLLASSFRGRALLRERRKERTIPIVVKQARAALDGEGRKQFALYLKAQDLYGCFVDPVRRAEEGMRRNPVTGGK